MSTVVPFTPEDAENARKDVNRFPPIVIEVFKELIDKDFNDHSSVVSVRKAVTRMVDRGLNKDEIYDNHWLDIEELFGTWGWKVEYEKPGFNEPGDSYFTFTKKKQKKS